MAVMSLFINGLVFPRFAAVCGLIFVIGRVIYTKGKVLFYPYKGVHVDDRDESDRFSANLPSFTF